MSKKDFKDVFSFTKDFTLGKNTFTLKPISIIELGAFQQMCSSIRKAEKEDEIINLYKKLGKEPSIEEIVKFTDNTDSLEDDMQHVMNRIDTHTHIIYKNVLSNNDTDITEEEFGNLCKSAEQLKDMIEFLYSEHNIVEPTEKKTVPRSKPKK